MGKSDVLENMKAELERFKLLKQAKEELGDDFYAQYCEAIKSDPPTTIPVESLLPEWQPSVTKSEKLDQFLENLDSNLIKLFKDKLGGWHINTQRNDRLEFQIEIEPNTEIDLLARNAVTNINKAKIKLDSKDGEYTFAYMFNQMFEYLGFSKRFEVDDKHYEGMGDNGDFKYGMRRLDIKLRQRVQVNYRWDLWVNSKDADVGYNEFILIRRDGDASKIGEQRRLTIAGYATSEQVRAIPPDMRNRRDRTLKYEVKEEDLIDLRGLISLVLKEVLLTEE
jgi:hypothetical protein